MTTHRLTMPRVSALLALALVSASCGSDDRRIPDAALYYEATGGAGGRPLLFCPGAHEQMIVPAQEPGQAYEPVAAWCSWTCARYEPDYPEPGSLVLILDRTGELTATYWRNCH